MKGRVAVLLFLPCLVLANPEADAEAVPEPEPEPEPQSPNMLYGPGPVPTSQGGLPPYGPDSFTGGNAGAGFINGLPPYGPDSFNGGNGGGSGFINGLPPYGPDSFTGGNAGGSGFINGLPPYGPDSFTGGNSGGCGMASQCCSAPEEGCCMGEQQCYYVWEKKCGPQAQPYCRTQTRKVCDPYTIKSCRTTRKQFNYDVPVTQCRTKRERKCFPYEKEVCEKVKEDLALNLTWTDDELFERGPTTKEKCIDIKTCNIVEDEKTVTRPVPERKCKTINVPRKECRSELVPQPTQQRTRVVIDIQYREQCYQVPKTQCEQKTCSTGSCYQPGQSTCSTTQVETRDVCNSCGSNQCQDNACQQVQVPMCGGGPSCQAGPQQCCRTVMEKVCRQVPYKVPRTVTESYQPPPKYEVKCDTVDDARESCRIVMVPKEYTVPTKRCESATENKCFTYNVPDQELVRKDQNEMIPVPSEKCNMKTVTEQHCTVLDVGVDCKEAEVRKSTYRSVRICDRQSTQRACFDVPYSECASGAGTGCQFVPRKVCQNSCPKTDRCNKCSQFVGEGGYSSCGTNQCSSYIPRDAVTGNTNMFNKEM